jgi:hypothetical protein
MISIYDKPNVLLNRLSASGIFSSFMTQEMAEMELAIAKRGIFAVNRV